MKINSFYLFFFWIQLSIINGEYSIPYIKLKPSNYNQTNSTLYTLCRNSDLFSILKTIQNIEDRFNKNYHYDWVFLNDKPFTSEFMEKVSNLVSGNSYFDQIPNEYWSYPQHVDLEFAEYIRNYYKSLKIPYGDSESYRHMCRFQSGFNHKTSFLNNYKYYWRIEPGIEIYCDINYDIFKYMEVNKKKFGFVISIFEYKNTIIGLWDLIKDWLLQDNNIEKVKKDSLYQFLINNPIDYSQNSISSNLTEIFKNSQYNLCHYWNNFEIIDMDFLRSQEYQEFFQLIDNSGGFYYSRYGDAIIHSIAINLFLSREELHWFSDVGYLHEPYLTCPLNDETYLKNKCVCNQLFDFTFNDYSCTEFWLKLMNWDDYNKKFNDDESLNKFKTFDKLYKD